MTVMHARARAGQQRGPLAAWLCAKCMPACMQMALAATQHIANHPTWARQRAGYIRKLLSPHLASAENVRLHHMLRELCVAAPMHAPLLMRDVALRLSDGVPPFSLTAA
jgi:hypothetical protein